MEWIKFECMSQAPWREDLLLCLDGKVYTYSPVYFPPAHPDEYCVVSRICSTKAKYKECCQNFAYGDMDKYKDKYWMPLPQLPKVLAKSDLET
jgi:hypothetical protein